MKLRKRFLLLYIFILLVFQMLAVFLIGSFLKNKTVQTIQDDYRHNIFYLETILSQFLEDVENDLLTISSHPDVRTLDDSSFTSYIGADENTFEHFYSREEQKIIDLFNMYRINHPYVNSVYMGRENGTFVRSHPRERNTDYDPRERPWYRQALANPGKVVRTDVYKSVTTSDMNLGTVKAIIRGGKPIGVIGIDVTLNNLRDFLGDIRISEDYDSDLLLMDWKGTLLYGSDTLNGTDMNTIFPDIFSQVRNGKLNLIRYSNTDRRYFYFTFSPQLQWYMGGLIENSEIERLSRSGLFSIIIWETLIMMILGGIIIYISDTYILERIQNLHDNVNLMKSGYFENSLIEYPINDEITLLDNSFRQLYNDWTRANLNLEKHRTGIVYCLGNLAETRDPETGNHIIRTQKYVKIIAERLKEKGYYQEIFTKEFSHTLYTVAPLHDIGKIGIPDHILLKPEKLTDNEFELMKEHTTLGYKALKNVITSGSSSRFFQLAAEIAWTHHEKWDGTGYPRGLKGEEIPLSGRIMALADTYDALMNKRVYKKAFGRDETKGIIEKESGKQLQPEIVQVYLELEDLFYTIYQDFRD